MTQLQHIYPLTPAQAGVGTNYPNFTVDGDFDLLVHIEDTGGPSNLDTLCKQLERLYNVVSAEKVGRRRHAERA